jgi:hypothetical protein
LTERSALSLLELALSLPEQSLSLPTKEQGFVVSLTGLQSVSCHAKYTLNLWLF